MKKEKDSSLILGNEVIFSLPFGMISSTQFLIFGSLAYLWKKYVLQSPTFN